jgi:hypothetical protein
LPLIDVQERASSPELIGGYHNVALQFQALFIPHKFVFKHQFIGSGYQRARPAVVPQIVATRISLWQSLCVL